MTKGFGVVGSHCYQDCKVCGGNHVCEHNLVDSSVNSNAPFEYRFVCTGRSGDCSKGEKFSCAENKDRRFK